MNQHTNINLTFAKHDSRHIFTNLKYMTWPLHSTLFTHWCTLIIVLLPDSPFKVAAEEALHWLWGYFSNLCWNAQQWTDWNAAQNPRFTNAILGCNSTHSGQDSPESCSSNPSGNTSTVVGVGWIASNIHMCCPAGTKPHQIYIGNEYRSKRQASQCRRSWPTLHESQNKSPVQLNESTKHHGIIDSHFPKVSEILSDFVAG